MKLIKVIYFSSNDFTEELRTELGINFDQLVALEIYKNGSFRYVVIKEGVVDYILKGEKE